MWKDYIGGKHLKICFGIFLKIGFGLFKSIITILDIRLLHKEHKCV